MKGGGRKRGEKGQRRGGRIEKEKSVAVVGKENISGRGRGLEGENKTA